MIYKRCVETLNHKSFIIFLEDSFSHRVKFSLYRLKVEVGFCRFYICWVLGGTLIVIL